MSWGEFRRWEVGRNEGSPEEGEITGVRYEPRARLLVDALVLGQERPRVQRPFPAPVWMWAGNPPENLTGCPQL